jgi:hypothetical protein
VVLELLDKAMQAAQVPTMTPLQQMDRAVAAVAALEP